ncbi:hypothetical protein GCM10022221_24590 [Actinocorallia aurea]
MTNAVKRIRLSGAGALVGLIGLLGGVPGAVVLAITDGIARGAVYRLGGPVDLSAEALFDDGFGFAVAVCGVFWVVLGGLLAALVLSVLKVLRVERRRPYWLLLCVAFALPYTAAQLSPAAGTFLHEVLF